MNCECVNDGDVCYYCTNGLKVKTCPQCKKIYKPAFSSREEAAANGGTAIQREQHQTGICSDKCYDAFLGIG